MSYREIIKTTAWLCFFIFPCEVSAQEWLIENVRYNLGLGLGPSFVQLIKEDNNPDFMNYWYADNFFNDGGLVFQVSCTFNKKWDCELGISPFGAVKGSDFYFQSYNRITKSFSFGGGFGYFGSYMIAYDYFYEQKQIEPYQLTGAADNFSKPTGMTVLYVGPSFRYRSKWTFTELTCNAGIGASTEMEYVVVYKKSGSNYKSHTRYKTKQSFGVFFFPQFKAGFDVFHFKHSDLGIMLQADCQISRQKMDYTKTITEWTVDNVITAEVERPYHWMGFGLISVSIYWHFRTDRNKNPVELE
jgi:hypothetical protein